MTKQSGFDRRSFLKGAGMTALAGAVGTGSVTAAAAETARASGGAYNFDEVYDRFGTECIKWDSQVTKWGDGKIKVGMGIADMDFRNAPCISEALQKRIAHENWGYTRVADSYIESIVDWNRERHGMEVDPDSIVISSGVHPGLIAALNTLCDPAQKVLVNTPTYNGFYGDLRWSRTIANESQMINNDGKWEIDWDDFEARLGPDTPAFLLCNPQNPTGNCWSEEDLMRMGQLCLENQVTVLADEIHCDFVMKGQKYTPFAGLPDKDIVDNSITFKAISKTFSLAAMKNAYWFTTNPVLKDRVRYNHRVDLNTLGMVANEAAYREGAEWLDQLLDYIDGNHEYVQSYMRESLPGMSYTKAEGTYLAWVDVGGVMDKIDAQGKSDASQSSDDPKRPVDIVEEWLVDNAGIQLNPGRNYGPGGETFMRMNLGAPRPLIKTALDSIAEAVDKA
ncbi:MAG: aminotransferase class I/II-fold pyridoxal phosphate-dependent enzyme [Woeseiaceae bacterium]|nr:aminotransferase class I/II-fold pyridoxal phosphate-dependent enzyme [Woeseiaceae bacterium]